MPTKVTKAQLAASNRYRKKSRKVITVELFPSDHYLADWIDSVTTNSRASYVKQLIKEDYEKNHQQ